VQYLKQMGMCSTWNRWGCAVPETDGDVQYLKQGNWLLITKMFCLMAACLTMLSLVRATWRQLIAWLVEDCRRQWSWLILGH